MIESIHPMWFIWNKTIWNKTRQTLIQKFNIVVISKNALFLVKKVAKATE